MLNYNIPSVTASSLVLLGRQEHPNHWDYHF